MAVDFSVVGRENSESVGGNIWVRFFFVVFDLELFVGFNNFWGVACWSGHADCGEDSCSQDGGTGEGD